MLQLKRHLQFKRHTGEIIKRPTRQKLANDHVFQVKPVRVISVTPIPIVGIKLSLIICALVNVRKSYG